MLNYARGNMTTGKVGRGVKVSDEADSGNVVGLGIGRKGSHKIAIVVQRDILKAKLVQLFFKMLRKNHLARSGRREISEFVALSVKLHILEKSVN